jgi:hypothetical protein
MLIFTAAILLKPETGKAQYLKISKTDGSIQSGELSSIRKITFTENEVAVNFKNGSKDLYRIDEINKLFFGQITTSVFQPAKSAELLTVYPNPVAEKLYFKNLPAEQVIVFIFRIDGVLMLQKEISTIENGIDVHHFSPGMYLVKASNQTTKFIKQ